MSQDAFGQPVDPNLYAYPQPPNQLGYPMASGYPVLVVPASHGRPGVVLASAILSWIIAGLLLVSACFVLGGAFYFASSSYDLYTDDGEAGVKLILLGVGNVICGALYIVGGIQAQGRAMVSRVVVTVAGAAVFVLGSLWLIWTGGRSIPYAIMFWTLAVLVASFLVGPSATRWFALEPSAPMPPVYSQQQPPSY